MKDTKFQFSFKVFALIALVLVVLVGWLVVGKSGDQGSVGKEEEEASVAQVEGRFVKGEPAPKLVVVSFDGGEVDLSQFYGEKAVVLDFWAGWCPFCIEEMPELQKAQDRFGDDLLMIGAHRTDTEAISVGKKFAQDRGVSYLLIKDGDGSLYRASGGIGMPVAVFIDKEGVVREIKSGPKTEEEIQEKVNGLF
jgi:thiol-disulfide isomerase/thioredoxin